MSAKLIVEVPCLQYSKQLPGFQIVFISLKELKNKTICNKTSLIQAAWDQGVPIT